DGFEVDQRELISELRLQLAIARDREIPLGLDDVEVGRHPDLESLLCGVETLLRQLAPESCRFDPLAILIELHRRLTNLADRFQFSAAQPFGGLLAFERRARQSRFVGAPAERIAEGESQCPCWIIRNEQLPQHVAERDALLAGDR